MAFQESGARPPQNKKMKWERLTRNLCPGCTSRLGFNFDKNSKILTCGAGCGFKISEERMKQVAMDILEDQGRDDEWEDFCCHSCGSPMCDGDC